MNLLLADDDAELATELAEALGPHGIEVAACPDGASALLHAGSQHPDIVLASGSLAGVSALDFVRAVRLALTAPVLVGIDGRSGSAEAIEALSAGATACVARPYRATELLYLIRLRDDSGPGLLRSGPITLNPVSYEVRVSGRSLQLPLREFELLHHLMRNAGRVVTRDEIRRDVWRSEGDVSANTIAVHVKRLRARLGGNGAQIQTVRGVGYRIPT